MSQSTGGAVEPSKQGSVKVRRALALGTATAILQYLLQPVPALILGYTPESGYFTAMPTWTSMLWVASALAVGVAVALGTAINQDWTAKAQVLFVTACVSVFLVATLLLSLPFYYGEWWTTYLVATGFSWAAVLAGLLATAAVAIVKRSNEIDRVLRDTVGTQS